MNDVIVSVLQSLSFRTPENWNHLYIIKSLLCHFPRSSVVIYLYNNTLLEANTATL